jgi:hypothetical protein
MAKKQQKRKVTQPQVEEQQMEVINQEAEMIEGIKKKVRVGLEQQKLEHYGYKVSMQAFVQMNSWLELTAMQWETLLDFVIGDMPKQIEVNNGKIEFKTSKIEGEIILRPRTAERNYQMFVKTKDFSRTVELVGESNFKIVYEATTDKVVARRINPNNISYSLDIISGKRTLGIAFNAVNTSFKALRNEMFAESLLKAKKPTARTRVVRDFFPSVKDFWIKTKVDKKYHIFHHCDDDIASYSTNGVRFFYRDSEQTIFIDKDAITVTGLEETEAVDILSGYAEKLSLTDKNSI